MFTGVHEVRVLQSKEKYLKDGKEKERSVIYAGYFNDPTSAVAAVERLSGYITAWATLNPIKPEALTADTVINPEKLSREHRTAAREHIQRRDWLLLDFDAARPSTDEPSTDAEKATAWTQAAACRDFLLAQGWPEPLLIDSGNGYHLRYRVNLSDDTDIIHGVLLAIQSNPEYSMLDTRTFDLNRVAKLPGTWSRKGSNTDERPHRQARVLELGSNGIVTREQLTAVRGDIRAGCATYEDVSEVTPEQADKAKTWLRGYMNHFGLDARTGFQRIRGGWKVGIDCPFDNPGHDEGPASSTALLVREGALAFSCLHNTCDTTRTGRNTRKFREVIERDKPPYDLSPAETEVAVVLGSKLGKPAEEITEEVKEKRIDISDRCLAESFLIARPDDFRLVVDLEPKMFASWSGAEWLIDPDKNVLHCAVGDHLFDLLKYVPRDAQDAVGKKLKSSAGVASTLNYLVPRLPAIRQSDFDREPYLLGLPGGKIADLRTGEVRTASREDKVSRLALVSPVTDHPTPRWDRFLLEVACGDVELARMLRDLAVLCLNGEPVQRIFCLQGGGRNGKGSYIRVLQAILGSLVRVLRPRQLSESKSGFADDSHKRTFSRLEGCRAVVVSEAEAKNLDYGLVKILSGGDTLEGAGMRENARQIQPTWKLLLVTNDEPVFPVDPAFKGRVVRVPFDAFFDHPETTIDATLAAEAPGILAQLIALSPKVVRDGVTIAAHAREATEEMFAELDLARQFSDACLTRKADGKVAYSDMVSAILNWAAETEIEMTEETRTRIIADLKKAPGVQYKNVKMGQKSVKGFCGVMLNGGEL